MAAEDDLGRFSVSTWDRLRLAAKLDCDKFFRMLVEEASRESLTSDVARR
jgi:hypothetical protein